MNHSEAIGSLAAALAKAQGAIESAPKDAVNPHFKSHYATLASIWGACRKALAANGLAVVQAVEADEAGAILSTLLVHTSGEWVESRTPLTCDLRNMQSLGSAISYAKRYALAALVGVVAEDDDDGNAAVAHAPQRGHEPPQRAYSGPTRQAMADVPSPAQRSNGGASVPRDGRALYGWAKEAGRLPAFTEWGKKHGKPGRMLDWSPEDVAEAWGRLQAPPAQEPSDHDDEPPF